MDTDSKQPVPWIFWILIFSVVFILGQSMYENTVSKNYSFFLEAPCDTATNECYVRDCNEEECPPDNYAAFRVFELPASQFKNCSDNSCLNICQSDDHSCSEILCSTQTEVACEGPIPTETVAMTTTTP